MAQSKYIQAVIKAQGGRPRSTEWYKDKIRELGKPGAMDLIRDGKRNADLSMVDLICSSITQNIERLYPIMIPFL